MITATRLRSDIFRLLDQVIETGQPIEITRKGQVLKLIATKKKSKLDNLKKNKISTEPLENFDHIDWSSEWTEVKKK